VWQLERKPYFAMGVNGDGGAARCTVAAVRGITPLARPSAAILSVVVGEVTPRRVRETRTTRRHANWMICPAIARSA
jgi:hypothetical protein